MASHLDTSKGCSPNCVLTIRRDFAEMGATAREFMYVLYLSWVCLLTTGDTVSTVCSASYPNSGED